MYVLAYTPYGADGIIIRIEADIRRGIPGIDITGLAEGAVREAKERVRAAFRNSGFSFPQDRVLINLAPAGVKKDGAALDLPIALAIMAASGHLPRLNDFLVMGELELSGELRAVRGVLAATAAGLKEGVKGFIVPRDNCREAAILVPGMLGGPSNLYEAVDTLKYWAEKGTPPPLDMGHINRNTQNQDRPGYTGDFSEVKGQERYKRALEIAAAGGHNLLVFGPPGAGKTMLARRLPSIMPRLTKDEAVEVTRLYSLAGQLKTEASLIEKPPFRSPHHSASPEGIMGGGRSVKPGEISLAHNGILFMDEGTEFKSHVLQSLREPLEDGSVTISRAEGPVRLPADFQLIVAANTCPCGRLGIRTVPGNSRGHTAGGLSCVCSGDEVYRYWRKFGNALLDRLELRVGVLPPKMTSGNTPGESSRSIAERVERAVSVQQIRFKDTPVRRNARMPPGMIDRFCPLAPGASRAFNTTMERLTLSGRACHGILRVSRTIADLEGSGEIQAVHILEAVEHRRQGDDPYDILSVDN